MQREEVLNQALSLLENHGILMPEITLIQNLNTDPARLRIFWPTHNDLVYDCLRYHGNQIDIWQRRVLLDESISGEDKLLARYTALAERVRENRFLAACLSLHAAPFRLLNTRFTNYPANRNKVLFRSRWSCSESWILMTVKWSHTS